MGALTNLESIGVLNRQLNEYMGMSGVMAKTVAIDIAVEMTNRGKFQNWVEDCVETAVAEYEKQKRGR